MITPEHAAVMARYNAWQNNQLLPVLEKMDEAELRLDRGAFFGSIQGTLNHLLWGDMLWAYRFGALSEAPSGGIEDSSTLWPDRASWAEARESWDTAILGWAEALEPEDLLGDLTWYSSVMQAEVRKPKALCITHFFNHQTHHRGQVHAMLTAAGQPAPVSDLIFMPEAS